MKLGEQPAGVRGRRPSTSRPEADHDCGVPARRERGEPATLRIFVALASFVVTAAIAAGLAGFLLAVRADNNAEAEQRQSLRGAVEALHSTSSELAQVEPQLIRMLERASGLKGLKFDLDSPEGNREVLSLIDHNGRIIGWFSWEAERPATAFMLSLLPLAIPIAIGLLTFVGLAFRQLNRFGLLLSQKLSPVQMRYRKFVEFLGG